MPDAANMRVREADEPGHSSRELPERTLGSFLAARRRRCSESRPGISEDCYQVPRFFASTWLAQNLQTASALAQVGKGRTASEVRTSLGKTPGEPPRRNSATTLDTFRVAPIINLQRVARLPSPRDVYLFSSLAAGGGRRHLELEDGLKAVGGWARLEGIHKSAGLYRENVQRGREGVGLSQRARFDRALEAQRHRLLDNAHHCFNCVLARR